MKISLHLRPILSALMRNRTGAVLVALQIAVSLAVLANAVFIVKQRVDLINRPSGVDVENIFVVMSQGFRRGFNQEATMHEDLAYLRGLDGVKAATAATHVPLLGTYWDDYLTLQPGDKSRHTIADFYEVDDHALDALGVRLAEGRNFTANEILPPRGPSSPDEFVPTVILSRAYAQELFQSLNPIGRTVYSRTGKPATVIGIVERMQGGQVDLEYSDFVVLQPRFPGTAYTAATYYIVRTEPGRQSSVMRTAEQHLARSDPNRIVQWTRPMQFFNARNHRDNRNMGIFLVTVTGRLLIVTALGIFGLATFNVSTRTKQIGTRRALGARRLDIVRHFLIENGLVTTAGIALGCVLALIAGRALTLHYGLPRLDLTYLWIGVLVLWVIGLAAAWRPARRAATISPAVATRTV